jgi:hypothetical protein
MHRNNQEQEACKKQLPVYFKNFWDSDEKESLGWQNKLINNLTWVIFYES